MYDKYVIKNQPAKYSLASKENNARTYHLDRRFLMFVSANFLNRTYPPRLRSPWTLCCWSNTLPLSPIQISPLSTGKRKQDSSFVTMSRPIHLPWCCTDWYVSKSAAASTCWTWNPIGISYPFRIFKTPIRIICWGVHIYYGWWWSHSG